VDRWISSGLTGGHRNPRNPTQLPARGNRADLQDRPDDPDPASSVATSMSALRPITELLFFL